MSRAKPLPHQKVHRILGEKLRQCRTGAGLSLKEMAVAIGLKPSSGVTAISAWERGVKRTTISWVEAYARYFHIELDWFFIEKPREVSFERRPGGLDLEHLAPEVAGTIIRALIEHTLEISSVLIPEPKIEMTKRRLGRLLEDLELTESA